MTSTRSGTTLIPADPSSTATAVVTVVAGGGGGSGSTQVPTDVGVTVSPSNVQIPASTYQAFSAVVTSLDDQTVTWSVENNPPNASVDNQGVFVAKLKGTYRVFATSTADPTKNGSAVIIVQPSVTLIPGAPSGTLNGYTVTTLKNGRVLLAGGSDGSSYQATGSIYDPSTGTFSPTYKMLNVEAALDSVNRKPWLQALKDAVGSGIINDVTYEHGGGHTGEHFSGNEIDMLPPSNYFNSNGDPVLGAFNDNPDTMGKYYFDLLMDDDVDHFINGADDTERSAIFNKLAPSRQGQINAQFPNASWKYKWKFAPHHSDHIHISFTDRSSIGL